MENSSRHKFWTRAKDFKCFGKHSWSPQNNVKPDKEEVFPSERDKNHDNIVVHDSFITNFFKLFSCADTKDWILMVIGSVAATLNGSALPIMALYFGKMTDIMVDIEKYGISHNYSQLSENSTQQNNSVHESVSISIFEDAMQSFAVHYLVISGAVMVSVFLQALCWETACERQVYTLRKMFFRQVMRQDSAWFDQHDEGDLPQKLSDDLERIREGIGFKMGLLIQYFASFISGLIVGFFASCRLTGVLLGVGPLFIGSAAYVAKEMFNAAAREQIRYGIAGSIASQAINCISVVTSFGGQSRESNRYFEAVEKGRKETTRRYYVLSVVAGSMFVFNYSSFSVAFWYGSQLIADGSISPGDVFAVFLSVALGAFSVGNSLPYLNMVATAVGAASNVFHVIENIPKIDPYSEVGVKLDKLNGHISLQNVVFSYPTRPDAQVLKGVMLDIKPGQSVALVGPSGSGKSTIIELLLRFYEYSSGQILIDGKDIGEINVHWLRNQIGLVSQEPILFGISIAENIRYGCKGATDEDVIKAAKMANIHNIISQFPAGYDTEVGDRGTFLSGGQKQRIAIARALIRDPRILLLDEATSALDTNSESVVQKALDTASKGRTTIIIAHRLSTIRNVDLIVSLKDGVVKETGTHDELMSKKGLYYDLVKLQNAQQEADQSITQDSTFEDEEGVINNIMQWKRQSGSFRKSFKRRHSSRMSVRRTSVIALEPTPEEVEKVSLFKLMTIQKKNLWLLSMSLFGFLIIGSSMPLFSSSYADAFYTFTKTGSEFYQSVTLWTAVYFGIAVTTGIGNFTAVLTSSQATESIIAALRISAFQKIIKQPVSWFDIEMYSPNRILNSLSRDPPLIKSAAGYRAGQIIVAVVTFITSFLIAYLTNWRLSVVLSCAVPFIIGAAYKHVHLIKKHQERDAQLMDQAAEVSSEGIYNIKTVQSLCKEDLFLERYMKFLELPYKEAKKQAYIFAFVYAISQGLIFVMYALAFYAGGFLVERDRATPTDVYRTFFAISFCASFIGQTSSYMQDFAKAKFGIAFLNHLVNYKSESIGDDEGLKPEIKGGLTLEKVHFRYPSRPEAKILDGLSLSVNPGQTLALVGASGCGKSTVISLIERFYSPTGGTIKLDGVDIRKINTTWLRRHMGLVTQEPVLFSSTIRDNIAYGAIDPDNVSMDDVIRAARMANIHLFISSLPKGYDTEVGDRGAMLSGGQKQRIAIARALIRDPRILLLDEATSALDSESEKIVQEALEVARAGRTSIIVAHRLSTIQNADIIAVIDRGRVVEKGTHAQLLALNGFYTTLMRQSTDPQIP